MSITESRPALWLVPEAPAGAPSGAPFDDADDQADAEALAVESHCLRRRAEREATALECGEAADRERVVAIVRGFKAYRPFLFDRDRALNDAAHRRLVDAYRAARDGRRPAVTA